MKGVAVVLNVWTYVLSLHLLACPSMRMNPEKHVMMLEYVKNILMMVKSGVFVDCAFISAHME